MSDATELNLSDRRTPTLHQRRQGLSLQTVAAIIAAIVALMAWFGVSPKSYAEQLSGLSSRVDKLEANRQDDSQRLERVEDKVDKILELERIAK